MAASVTTTFRDVAGVDSAKEELMEVGVPWIFYYEIRYKVMYTVSLIVDMMLCIFTYLWMG